MGTSLSVHSQSYFSQPRLTPIMPVADADACLVSGYHCPPRHTTIPSSPPSSSPTLHDLTPMAYSKCLPNSPTHAAPPGSMMPSIQENPNNLTHPASPDHSTSLTMLHTQGSPNHINSPGPHGYSHIYPGSSPSSSPASHPSTPGGSAESPFVPVSSQNGENSPTVLCEDSSSPPIPITIKQEPQELDQMYLDDGKCQNKMYSVVTFPYVNTLTIVFNFYNLWQFTKQMTLQSTPFSYRQAPTHIGAPHRTSPWRSKPYFLLKSWQRICVRFV